MHAKKINLIKKENNGNNSQPTHNYLDLNCDELNPNNHQPKLHQREPISKMGYNINENETKNSHLKEKDDHLGLDK
jgi:hypothetical protein